MKPYNERGRVCAAARLSRNWPPEANQKGDWCEAPHRDNVQAFEEKFNVFMMRQALPLPVAITQQRVRDVAGIGSHSLSPRSSFYLHPHCHRVVIQLGLCFGYCL